MNVPRLTPKTAVLLAVIAVVILGSWYLEQTGQLGSLMSNSAIQSQIRDLGPTGPLIIIGLMAGAIVVSPVPSAPIALASGAVYGHIWGTVYVLIGAEIGAVIAFLISRLLGYEILRRWLGENRLSFGLLGSQKTLMGIVFVSRLLPFISFDLVSYAAGLSQLSLWRFFLATLAGIIPASFILTHIGGEMLSGNPQRIMLAGVLLGTVTLIPILIGIIRCNKSKARHGVSENP